jgi:transposase-like protein
MSKAIARDPIYRRRRFQPEIIELCVRWYLTYRLSHRDLVEMMAERGVVISHSTILRWVQRYVLNSPRAAAHLLPREVRWWAGVGSLTD